MALTTVHIMFDKEKVLALQMFLPRKNTTLEAELQKKMDDLYRKKVPEAVRSFIDNHEEKS